MEERVEQVVVMIKPDGMALGLTKVVKKALSSAELILIYEKPLRFTRELILKWHPKKKHTGFWNDYVDFLTSADCFLMVWEGRNARSIAIALKGSTVPPQGLRGEYSNGRVRNIMHSTETPEETKRELEMFFSKELGTR